MDLLIAPHKLRAQLSDPNPPTVIDVREEDAFRAGHIAGARHIPIDDLTQRLVEISKDRPVVTY